MREYYKLTRSYLGNKELPNYTAYKEAVTAMGELKAQFPKASFYISTIGNGYRVNEERLTIVGHNRNTAFKSYTSAIKGREKLAKGLSIDIEFIYIDELMTDTIMYLQKFRILLDGKVFDGRNKHEAFNTINKAREYRDYYAHVMGLSTDRFKIEPLKSPVIADDKTAYVFENGGKELSDTLRLNRVLSGKGLKNKLMQEGTKYSAEGFERNGNVNYKSDVDNYKGPYFFRSMERNKGLSLIRHKGKNKSIGGGFNPDKINEFKSSALTDYSDLKDATIEKLNDRFKELNITTLTDAVKFCKHRLGMSNKKAKEYCKHLTFNYEAV